MVQTAVLPSVSPDRHEALKLVPRKYITDTIFIRSHLRHREIVIGVVGERGAGKSGSTASIGLLSFMLQNKPLWSNMNIACDIDIPDYIARREGFNYGGVAHYESKPLDKVDLLDLSEEYRGGCLAIEEINVQFSNVRRTMSNTNVDSNEAWQQLRKFGTSLVYNVIDEMFIDPQLRELTDIFIYTYDEAFDIDSLMNKKSPGEDFNWTIFPMSAYLRGQQGKYRKYGAMSKPLKAHFHFKPFRDIYDDKKHQEKGIYTMSRADRLKLKLEAESSNEMDKFMTNWDWLIDKLKTLKHQGAKYMTPVDLTQYVGMPLTTKIKEVLKVFGVSWDNYAQMYKIESFTLGNTPSPLTS